MNFKIAGMIIAIPTVALALYITYLHRHIFSELAHNIAVCCWLFANITWMTGEFFYNDTTRHWAILLFATGLLVLAYYYIIYLPFLRKS